MWGILYAYGIQGAWRHPYGVGPRGPRHCCGLRGHRGQRRDHGQRPAATTSPAGFSYGTDSWPASVTGTGPYFEPVIGGHYSAYIGMAGNWARTEGCKTGNFLAWSSANSAQANVNFTKYHGGFGTGVYWYMGGPGVDPHWNGSTTEAYRWGVAQAADALAAMKKLTITSPVVWADIELPGILPAKDNGWNSVYTSPCSEQVKESSVPANVDRSVLNGFAAYVTAHSTYKVGVYSSAPVWTSIFGTGTASLIPNTYEWTYLPETSNLSRSSPPAGACTTHDVRAVLRRAVQRRASTR